MGQVDAVEIISIRDVDEDDADILDVSEVVEIDDTSDDNEKKERGGGGEIGIIGDSSDMDEEASLQSDVCDNNSKRRRLDEKEGASLSLVSESYRDDNDVTRDDQC